MSVPNMPYLRKLYDSTHQAKYAFEYFATRQNNSSRTTVDRLRAALRAEGRDVTRSDVVELFKGLEQAGCGTFVVGRKGHPSRFEWIVSLVDVGRSAAGQSVKIEAIWQSEREEDRGGTEKDEFIAHPYHLRPDVELKLDLPADLTAAEANRIAEFVRTLPFK